MHIYKVSLYLLYNLIILLLLCALSVLWNANIIIRRKLLFILFRRLQWSLWTDHRLIFWLLYIWRHYAFLIDYLLWHFRLFFKLIRIKTTLELVLVHWLFIQNSHIAYMSPYFYLIQSNHSTVKISYFVAILYLFLSIKINSSIINTELVKSEEWNGCIMQVQKQNFG